MPSNQSFDHFYANVSCKSEACLVNERFQESKEVGLEVGASAPTYPQTANDHFRRVYYEAIDLSVSATYQESFRCYIQMETLLVKLLMVTTMRQILSFLKHHSAKMLIQGRYLGMSLSILEVTLKRRYHVLMKSSRWCQSFQNQKRSYTVILFRSPNYLHAYCKSWN